MYDIHNPPLLFNINWDPSEKHPIFSDNEVYDKIVNYMIKKRIEFDLSKSTSGIMKNEIGRGSSVEYGLCCNHKKNCVCNVTNSDAFVCVNSNVNRVEISSGNNENNNMWSTTWIIFIVCIVGLCVYGIFYKYIYSRKGYEKIRDPPRRTMPAYMMQF
eukprot:473218_1